MDERCAAGEYGGHGLVEAARGVHEDAGESELLHDAVAQQQLGLGDGALAALDADGELPRRRQRGQHAQQAVGLLVLGQRRRRDAGDQQAVGGPGIEARRRQRQ